MATKRDFAADQWRRLLQAPLLVGFAVSAAAPSGFIGTLLESMASADALAAARAENANELVRSVVDDLLTARGRNAAREEVQRLIQGAEMTEIRSQALAKLREAAQILDTAAPQDSAAFKDWLAQIAICVAGAATEGGFLGFGGERICAAERAALAEIDVALAR